MNITIYIPDDKVQDIINAFTTLYGYENIISNPDYDPNDPESQEFILNTETKAQFSLRQIRLFIKQVYVAYKVSFLDAQKPALVETSTEEIDEVTVN